MNDTFQKNKDKIVRSGIRLAIYNTLFIFSQLTGLTLLSAACIAIIDALILTAAYFRLKGAVGAEGKSEPFGGAPLIRQEKLRRYYETLYVEINNGIQTIRKAALFTDPIFSAKILIILFVTSNVAKHLGDFGFAWLAGNGYLAYPLIILFFGPQIKAVIKTAEDLIQAKLAKQKKD